MTPETPEVPEIFNLLEDPFPHLRIRDALMAGAMYVVNDYYAPPKPHSFDLENVLDIAVTLEEPEKDLLRDFFWTKRERDHDLPTERMRDWYVNYWGHLYRICSYHKLQAKYGDGTDQPDSHSDDDDMMKLHDSSQELTREALHEMLALIKENNYRKLLEFLLQKNVQQIEWLKQHAENGESYEPNQDQAEAGLYAAHADAHILLLLLENTRRSPRLQTT